MTVWLYAVRQIYAIPLPPDAFARPYLDVAVETNPWLEPWQRWDTLHYQAITERGYTAFDGALFTPPLYPLLMRLASFLTGGQTLSSGILVSNVASFLLLITLYKLADLELGDRFAARRTIIYLVSFPTAFFLFAAYTESLFLLAAVSALYHLRLGHWLRAGLWGGLASLVRLPGAIIIVPLVYVAWLAWRQQHSWRVWFSVSLAVIGAAIFPLYVWLGMHLPPWAPIIAQTARFGGGFAFPGANIVAVVQNIFNQRFFMADVFDLGFTLLFLIGLIPVWRKLPRIYGVYYLAFIALYLTRRGGAEPLLSMARYVLALFPAFLLLGKWSQRKWLSILILFCSWLGLLFMSGQFAIWGWVG